MSDSIQDRIAKLQDALLAGKIDKATYDQLRVDLVSDVTSTNREEEIPSRISAAPSERRSQTIASFNWPALISAIVFQAIGWGLFGGGIGGANAVFDVAASNTRPRSDFKSEGEHSEYVKQNVKNSEGGVLRRALLWGFCAGLFGALIAILDNSVPSKFSNPNKINTAAKLGAFIALLLMSGYWGYHGRHFNFFLAFIAFSFHAIPIGSVTGLLVRYCPTSCTRKIRQLLDSGCDCCCRRRYLHLYLTLPRPRDVRFVGVAVRARRFWRNRWIWVFSRWLHRCGNWRAKTPIFR